MKIIEKKQYILPLFFTLVTLFFAIYITRNIPPTLDLTKFYYGAGLSDAILLIFMPFIFNLIAIPFGILFIRVYFLISKILKRNYDFKITILEGEKIKGFPTFTRTLLPSFLSLSIGLVIMNFYWLINVRIIGYDPTTTILFAALLTTPLCSILIIPIWLFHDCGIIEIKRLRKDFRLSPEVNSVGQFYKYLLRGYAGITTPIFYYLTFAKIFTETEPLLQIVIFFFPIALIGYFMPLTIIYELLFNKIKKLTLRIIRLEKITLDEIFI